MSNPYALYAKGISLSGRPSSLPVVRPRKKISRATMSLYLVDGLP